MVSLVLFVILLFTPNLHVEGHNSTEHNAEKGMVDPVDTSQTISILFLFNDYQETKQNKTVLDDASFVIELFSNLHQNVYVLCISHDVRMDRFCGWLLDVITRVFHFAVAQNKHVELEKFAIALRDRSCLSLLNEDQVIGSILTDPSSKYSSTQCKVLIEMLIRINMKYTLDAKQIKSIVHSIWLGFGERKIDEAVQFARQSLCGQQLHTSHLHAEWVNIMTTYHWGHYTTDQYAFNKQLLIKPCQIEMI